MRLKNFWNLEQGMTSIDLATDYARRLVAAEARGPGDLEPAMRRLEARTGIGFWTIWGLWHRKRKEVGHDLFSRLRHAYLSICERQLSSLKHEVALQKALCGDDAFEDIASEMENLLARLETLKAKKARP